MPPSGNEARWLVTGARGQLGTHLLDLLGGAAIGLAHADLDISSATAVKSVVREARPEVVVNAAAYTAVDAAESDEAAAYEVNATAVAHLATACASTGARLLHVSTDYVFDGTASHPYRPDDPTGPRTVYGRTKLAGEEFALERGGHVVRTAWVYGGPSANFVDTMLRLATQRETLDVVSDQVGSPTYVRDLAAALVDLGRLPDPPALLHYANAGMASWFDLAQEAFRAAGLDPDRVRPVSSAEFVRPAPRPAWSVLSLDAWTEAGLPAPRDWRAAVRDYVGSRG